MRDDIIPILETHLVEFNKPFDWKGGIDCMKFCMSWANKVTGRDFFSEFRPWDSKFGAARSLYTAGFKTLNDAITSRLPERSVASARPGDLVSHPTIIGPATGICVGRKAAFVGLTGLAFDHLFRCDNAWTLG